VETITASGGTISSGIRGGGKEFEGGMSVEDDPYQDDAISERIFRHMSWTTISNGSDKGLFQICFILPFYLATQHGAVPF
jgi:hypothetical protein